MARAIDAGILQDNLIDIYGDCYRLVYLKDVLDLIYVVRTKVHMARGVWLEPEVRILGREKRGE